MQMKLKRTWKTLFPCRWLKSTSFLLKEEQEGHRDVIS